MWGRSGQNCSLLSQKRNKNLVIAALCLAGNREDTTEFGVLWVLNTHTTDCAAKCHRYKHWGSLCKKPPTPKLFYTYKYTHKLLIVLWMSLPWETTAADGELREDKCRPLMLSWHVRNSGLLLLDWGLIIWRISCTRGFGELFTLKFCRIFSLTISRVSTYKKIFYRILI